MKKYCFMALFVALMVVLITGPSTSATLSEVGGIWSNTVGGSNLNYPIGVPVSYGNGSENQVRWGVGPAGQSGLGFTGAAPPAIDFTIGDEFEIGQMRHFNAPVNEFTASTSTNLAIPFNQPCHSFIV